MHEVLVSSPDASQKHDGEDQKRFVNVGPSYDVSAVLLCLASFFFFLIISFSFF